MKLVENKLIVLAHEWAGSVNQSGRPIYAYSNGELVKIGETRKYTMAYPLPQGTRAIVRTRVSNSGYRTFYVYLVPNLDRCITISELNRFNFYDLEVRQLKPSEEEMKLFNEIRNKILASLEEVI